MTSLDATIDLVKDPMSKKAFLILQRHEQGIVRRVRQRPGLIAMDRPIAPSQQNAENALVKPRPLADRTESIGAQDTV